MNNRNCPNCGAPYQIDLNQCPYCGTSYFDMSAIDFTNGEPFYLKFKVNMGGRECYITQLVRPRIESMEFSSDSVEARDVMGNRVCSFVQRQTVTTNISFESIPDKKGKELFTIKVH